MYHSPSADQPHSLSQSLSSGGKMALSGFFLPHSPKTSPDAWQVNFAERVKAIENRKKVYSVVFPKHVKVNTAPPTRCDPSPTPTPAAIAGGGGAVGSGGEEERGREKTEKAETVSSITVCTDKHRGQSPYALEGDLSVTGSTVDDSHSLVSSIALSASASPPALLSPVDPRSLDLKPDGKEKDKDKSKSRIMRGGGKGAGNTSPVRDGGVGVVGGLLATVPPCIPATATTSVPAPLTDVTKGAGVGGASVPLTNKMTGAGDDTASTPGGRAVSKTPGPGPNRGKWDRGRDPARAVLPADKTERNRDKDRDGADRKGVGASVSPGPSTRRLSPVPPQTQTQSRTLLTSLARPAEPESQSPLPVRMEEMKTPPRQRVEAVSAVNPFLALALPVPAPVPVHTPQQVIPPVSPPAASSGPQSPRRDSTFLKALMGAINGTPRSQSPVPLPHTCVTSPHTAFSAELDRSRQTDIRGTEEDETGRIAGAGRRAESGGLSSLTSVSAGAREGVAVGGRGGGTETDTEQGRAGHSPVNHSSSREMSQRKHRTEERENIRSMENVPLSPLLLPSISPPASVPVCVSSPKAGSKAHHTQASSSSSSIIPDKPSIPAGTSPSRHAQGTRTGTKPGIVSGSVGQSGSNHVPLDPAVSPFAAITTKRV